MSILGFFWFLSTENYELLWIKIVNKISHMFKYVLKPISIIFVRKMQNISHYTTSKSNICNPTDSNCEWTKRYGMCTVWV